MVFGKDQPTQYERKSFAVGGKERVRVSAYRITFDDGTELELQGRYTTPGHARLQALEYMDARNRKSDIVSTVKIPIDPEMEKIRNGKAAVA